MRYSISIFLLLTQLSVFSQKKITLKEAEQELQKNNLILLAEQYNITAAQAAVIQAKIWDQPYVSFDINAFNPERNKLFDVGNNGQKVVAIEQLIYLGGKKKNEVAFAKTNAEIAALQFEDLLRNLKYQLYQDFYSVYFNFRKIDLLDTQIDKLDQLVKEYQVQAEKNNVALKEVVRLQALLLSLRNDRSLYNKEIISFQEELKLLLSSKEAIDPQVEELEIKKFDLPKIAKEELFDKALQKDPTYLTSLKIVESQEFYLKWQKALSVPDITLGAAYDQRGGAFNNQLNMTLGVPLPLWNKNKGNIRVARAEWNKASLDSDYRKAELQNKIESAWNIWEEEKQQVVLVNKMSKVNLELVYKGILDNFQKRNITLIEFVDFMESYRQSILQFNELMRQFVISGVSLNYITNLEIF